MQINEIVSTASLWSKQHEGGEIGLCTGAQGCFQTVAVVNTGLVNSGTTKKEKLHGAHMFGVKTKPSTVKVRRNLRVRRYKSGKTTRVNS